MSEEVVAEMSEEVVADVSEEVVGDESEKSWSLVGPCSYLNILIFLLLEDTDVVAGGWSRSSLVGRSSYLKMTNRPLPFGALFVKHKVSLSLSLSLSVA
jgi:hypothetical protein